MPDPTWDRGRVDLLARTIWGEARGEGYEGMQAVANVVMNRIAQPRWWGHDVISVCLKPWQFSCWDQGDLNQAKVQTVDSDDPVFVIANEIAVQAIAGTLPDITNGATSYKETSLPWPTEWGAECGPRAVIGHHSFFVLT